MLSERDRFQYDVATGRGTLPVVSVITLVVWIISFSGDWLDAMAALFCCGLSAYLLIEMDTHFALMRTRTTLPSCLLLAFYAVAPFLHEGSAQSVVAPLFVLTLFSLLRSYESYGASSTIFHAFLFTGLAGLVVPCVVWTFPILFICMIYLRSLSMKTFLAGIIGMVLPYWFLFCYGVYIDDISWGVLYLSALVRFRPVIADYASLSIGQLVSLGILLLFFIVYGAFYMQSAYKDKVQTRIMLQVIFWMGVWAFVLMLLQPHYLNALFPAAAVSTAVLGGHLFALSFNRVVRVTFYSTIILLALLLIFNQWIQLFIS